MLALESHKVQRILLVRTSALGDVVHVLPSLEALRLLFPAAEISWIIDPLGARLLAGHPALEEIIEIPRQRWKRQVRRPSQWLGLFLEVFRLSRNLRRKRFDLVLDFHSSLKSAAILLLAGGRHRLGFHRADIAETGGGLLTNHKAPQVAARTNKVEKNLGLVRELGFQEVCPRGRLALSTEDKQWARALIDRLPGTGPVVALHPAVSHFGQIKRWPVEYFRTLVDSLQKKHDARILLTWGPGEREVAESIGRPTVLESQVGLLRFAALLSSVDLLIAADTGALPMAALLGTSTVGIFGPKDPALYAPYPTPGEIVTSPAPCSPCTLRKCEHRICTALIQPQAVLEAAERALLSNSPSAIGNPP
jgi:lipopolysaccharide heptosyltransferase I